MKTQVKALVVGGGAVGTSIAYHLAKAGWDDVMLIERDELTSGSTWHAAGLLPLFNMVWKRYQIRCCSLPTTTCCSIMHGVHQKPFTCWRPGPP